MFYYKPSEYADCPQQVQLIVTHSICVVWAADKIFRIEFVLFTLTAGRVECLSFVCVALCHTHLSVSQMEVCSYSELHTECLYADIKKGKFCSLLSNVICLKFLDHEYRLQLYLNRENC